MPKEKHNPSEIHLFIVWEHARTIEEKIIDDISKKFNIIKTFEVHWSKSKFPENLSRFYGTLLPPNSRKEVHVGTNPFLAIIVEDLEPNYDTHTTSKGDVYVNSKLFITKAKLREWTGGGHKIHASNTVEEADHNLTMLFGKNAKDFLKVYGNDDPKQIEIWKEDLVGSRGWQSLSQLFYVLNNTMRYVVLRNFDALPDKYYAKDHGDIDLLVYSYKDACFLTKSEPVFKSKFRVYNKVKIANDKVLFDFRHLDDNYYDTQWQEDMLKNRKYSKKGFYIPSEKDYLYSSLYHALIHKQSVSPDYVAKLSKLAGKTGVSLSKDSFGSTGAMENLADYMADKSYNFTQPDDKSVFINLENIKAVKNKGVSFKRRKMIPLRNYLKKWNFPLKHYMLKARKIIRRHLRGVDTGQ